jgi:tRNA(Arg) A34 adenosine deaminase TadA
MKRAQKLVGDKHLRNGVLLTTCEPCLHCSAGVVNTEIPTVVQSITHDDVKDRLEFVNGLYRPWRTTPDGFKGYLESQGVEVVSGFMHEQVIERMSSHDVNFREHYDQAS